MGGRGFKNPFFPTANPNPKWGCQLAVPGGEAPTPRTQSKNEKTQPPLSSTEFSRPDKTDPKYPRPLDSLQLKNFAKIFSFELRSIIDSWHSNLNAE